MKQMLLRAVLGPVLVLQGRYVRWRVPKLSEPAGSRRGVRGKGPPLRLLIAGDSAAAGVGVRSQEDALSGQLLNELSERFEVHWRLIAFTGATTASLTRLLSQTAEEPCDVVLVSVGVNDVTSDVSRSEWCSQLSRLHALMSEKFSPAVFLFTSLPPLREFPALPQPLRWYLGRQGELFNGLLSEWCSKTDRVRLVSVKFPVDPRFMASDGFHPGAQAYAVWARQVAGHLSSKEFARARLSVVS